MKAEAAHRREKEYQEKATERGTKQTKSSKEEGQTDAPTPLTTTSPPWLTLLTREWGLSGQPCHSLLRVAWHKVGGSTFWTVLSGRLGEARSQPGDCMVQCVKPDDGWWSC